MDRIIVRTQEKYDAISMGFCGEIIIDSSPEVAISIHKAPPQAVVTIAGQSNINYVDGSAIIKEVCGSAIIKEVCDSAIINYVCDSATINYVYGSATINCVCDSAIINYVCDSATINYVYGSAIVIGNPGRVQGILGGGQVIQRIYDYSYSVADFIKIKDVETDGDFLYLYKSVVFNTLCDSWTGRIKYEGVVECPDFDSDPLRQCGGGLHLSPTPEEARSYYSQGKILKCKVHKDDIVIYSKDLSKVRCRKVEVSCEVE